MHVTTKNKKVPFDKFAGQFYCFKVLSLKSSMYCQCSKFPVVRSSLTTKNDYGRPEFVTKLSEWRPEIFFYPDAEIYSFQVLWVDFPKLPLKMAINISLQINDHRNFGIVDIWPESNTDAVSGYYSYLINFRFSNIWKFVTEANWITGLEKLVYVPGNGQIAYFCTF